MPTEQIWNRERQFGTIASGQVVVSTAATEVAPYRFSRMQLDICMMGSQAVYLGTSSVTVGSGAYLAGTAGTGIGIYSNEAIYGVCSAGTVALSIFESLSS